MKNFWPHRSDVKGFSIENLALKYRKKISNSFINKDSTKLKEEKTLDSSIKAITDLPMLKLSIKRGHWANRDFSEYRKVA